MHKHTNQYRGAFLFTVLLFTLSIQFASAQGVVVLAEREQHTLTQAQINSMLLAGQNIARQEFTDEEKQALQAWGVELFQRHDSLTGVLNAFGYYQHYLDRSEKNKANKAVQALLWHQLYQEMYFKWTFPRYQEGQQTLMDVITRYNPPLVIDDKHQLLLTQGQFDDVLETAHYFSGQLGLELIPEYGEVQRQQLVNSFVNRENLTVSNVNNDYLLRSQSFWQQLSPAEQQQLTAVIRGNYQQNPNIWQALKPFFTQLDAVIQLESQQRAFQEQIMANVLLQQLQVNQKIYNNVLRSYREAGDRVTQAISDQSTRQSVHISGGRVLETHRDHFLVESRAGVRYRISR